MTEFDWTYDDDRRLMHVRYHGLVSLDVFNRAREARRSLALAAGQVRVLIDARDADLSNITANDFKMMEAQRADHMDSAADRAAGLVGREIDVGIAQLWALYRNQSVPGSTAVFMNERKAMEWLFGGD